MDHWELLSDRDFSVWWNYPVVLTCEIELKGDKMPERNGIEIKITQSAKGAKLLKPVDLWSRPYGEIYLMLHGVPDSYPSYFLTTGVNTPLILIWWDADDPGYRIEGITKEGLRMYAECVSVRLVEGSIKMEVSL